jgi:uncharacterized membrane protein
MKRKLSFLLLLVLALALTLTPIALAQTRANSRADMTSPRLEPAGTSSGHYHLTSAAVQISSGGGYRLVGSVGPTLTGSGCCCTYLICVIK